MQGRWREAGGPGLPEGHDKCVFAEEPEETLREQMDFSDMCDHKAWPPVC